MASPSRLGILRVRVYPLSLYGNMQGPCISYILDIYHMDFLSRLYNIWRVSTVLERRRHAPECSLMHLYDGRSPDDQEPRYVKRALGVSTLISRCTSSASSRGGNHLGIVAGEPGERQEREHVIYEAGLDVPNSRFMCQLLNPSSISPGATYISYVERASSQCTESTEVVATLV